jgi:hypothetical protein
VIDFSDEDRRALDELPERIALDRAVSADPDFAWEIGSFIRSGAAGFTTDIGTLRYLLAFSIAGRTGSLEFQREEFDSFFTRLMGQVRSRTRPQITSAVLVGVRADKLPMLLSPEVTIDRLSEDEAPSCFQCGLIPVHEGRGSTTGVLAIRVRLDLPKVKEPDVVPPFPEARVFIDDVLTALRLLKAGRVAAAGHVTTSNGLSGSASSCTRDDPVVEWGQGYQLGAGDAAELTRLYSQLSSKAAKSDRAIQVALRRFGYAQIRTRPEDRILDLLIAAEALFLTGSGDPLVRSELAFRLSIRAAHLLSPPGDARKQAFADWRDAYLARSAVVHGADPAEIRKRLGRDLSEICSVTEAHLRSGLRVVLERTTQREKLDWDDLVLS